jgi:hypothetical protein
MGMLRDALLIALAACGVGLGVNSLRPDGLPLVAEREYDLFVPCPEPLGVVEALDPADPRLRAPGTLLVDARDMAVRQAAPLAGAEPVPFDYLASVSRDTVARLAASGAARVVVAGDGADPDSGRELARELAGQGLKNVSYVSGGAPALLRRAAGVGVTP